MSRVRVFDEPMDTVQRVQRNRAAKLERGEARIDTWINPEAAAALQTLTGGSSEKGAVKTAIEVALINQAKKVK
jgi:hypothetical protein